ncbi:MAG: proline--tRNA ligase, partial [Clostridiales bacterium]|nr:proline--tRNA ligase [Clostridiales bacterium]
FNEWELKGVPLRLEVGPRDVANGVATYMRRDTLEKGTLPLDTLAEGVHGLLQEIQDSLLAQARAFMQEKTADVFTMEALAQQVDGGYARAMWCGQRACEDKIKDETGATSRNMPFDQTPFAEHCVCCGEKAQYVMYFAKSY